MKKFSFFYVPVPNKASALKISRTLISESLVACANIISSISSIYLWKGKMENSRETLLILKTEQALAGALRKRLQQIHPYKIPCIAEIRLHSLNREYAQWLKKQLKENSKKSSKKLRRKAPVA